MKIYDLSKNKVVQFPDYIARLKLRARHISQGGIYCQVQDIEKYVSTPPVVKEQKPVEVTVDAKNAQPEMQYAEEVPDTTDKVVRKRRKRKTE